MEISTPSQISELLAQAEKLAEDLDWSAAADVCSASANHCS